MDAGLVLPWTDGATHRLGALEAEKSARKAPASSAGPTGVMNAGAAIAGPNHSRMRRLT